VLADRKRRALRVHLPADVKGGLEKLAALVDAVLEIGNGYLALS